MEDLLCFFRKFRKLRALFVQNLALSIESVLAQTLCFLEPFVTQGSRLLTTADREFPIKPFAQKRPLLAPVPRCVLACRYVLDAAFLNRLAIRRTQEASVLDLLLGLTTSV